MKFIEECGLILKSLVNSKTIQSYSNLKGIAESAIDVDVVYIKPITKINLNFRVNK